MKNRTNVAVLVAMLFALPLLGGCLNDKAEDTSDPTTASTEPGGDSGTDPGTDPVSNTPPTISGTPPDEARIGQQYSFTPNASDPDGDTLTFSISNKPSWADFDTGNGRLRGTPSAGDEGTYSNIRITVSDGSASASTPQFSVEVQQVSMGSVTLSWSAPTQNTDSTPLTDLSAYKVYYGTSAGNYPNEISISNPGLTTYVVENLPADTYFFVSTAVNSSGVESNFSNVLTRVVN